MGDGRYDDETGRPGWFAGNDREPAQYRLIEQVHRGGEGVVWQARRPSAGHDASWAVKILLGRHLDRGDDETLQQSLDRWEGIWDATIERTALLHGIQGIVPAIRVFQGPAPHPQPRPAPGSPRTLYLVTPWVDGQDLHEWHRRQRRDLAAVTGVVTQLCHLVDRLADHGQVHRDISPRNVMVDGSGRISLIDFAFMRPARTEVTHIVTKPGFTAPEYEIDPANDRYSVGAVVHQLLTDAPPPQRDAGDAARRGLVERGYSRALADHVALLLHPDPRRRPARLGPWSDTLRDLAVRRVAPGGYADLAVATDTEGSTELVAAGAPVVAVARLAPTLHLAFTADVGGPDGTASIAAVRRGNGDVAVFACDEGRGLWLRLDGRWHRQPGVSAVGPVRAGAHGDGAVSAYTVTDRGLLAAVTVPLTGEVVAREFDVQIRRVFAATTGPGGRPAIAAEGRDGALLCGPPERPQHIGLSGVQAADLTMNQWGELVCVAVDAGDGRVALVERLGGEWDLPEWLDAPPGATDVACVGHRGGISVAVAGGTGLWIRRGESAAWSAIWNGATTRVVAGPGLGWRIQVAGISAERVIFAEETAAGDWPATATEIR